MNLLHLAEGSKKPELEEGKPYLFSMKFCPYAHRPRLAFSLKQVNYETININLQKKPKWYFNIHPKGQVPAFIGPDGKIVIESEIIVKTIDQMYPDPPLFNEETKIRDLELIANFGKITSLFDNCIHSRDNRSLDEIFAEISQILEEFENELKIRATDFFGGEKPGIVEIMIWPWMERLNALFLIHKQQINWTTKMKLQDFVIENADPYEKFAKLVLALKEGPFDCDAI